MIDKDFISDKKVAAAIAVLVAGFLFLVWLCIQVAKTEIQRIDESGGLKALVERVWEGKPDE